MLNSTLVLIAFAALTMAPYCWRPAPTPDPWDTTLPVITATADLGYTYQDKKYGDPNKLEGVDIQAAICHPACNERCAILLAHGTYRNVEVQVPDQREITHNPTSCGGGKNECGRLGYTGISGYSKQIEIFGHGERNTVLRLANRTDQHRNCDYAQDPPIAGPLNHLKGAITIRYVPTTIALHDFTIDGRLSEQPLPPGGNVDTTKGTYGGIEQGILPYATFGEQITIRNVTIRNIVDNAVIVRHMNRAELDHVTIENVGVTNGEPGMTNKAWAVLPRNPGGVREDKYAGVGFVFWKSARVTKSNFVGSNKMSISCMGCQDTEILDNTFSRSRTGVSVGAWGAPWPKNVTIDGNTMRDMGLATDPGNPNEGTTGVGLLVQLAVPDGTDLGHIFMRRNTFERLAGGALQSYWPNDLATSSAEVDFSSNTMKDNCLRRADFFGGCNNVVIFDAIPDQNPPRALIDKVWGAGNTINGEPGVIADSGLSVEPWSVP